MPRFTASQWDDETINELQWCRQEWIEDFLAMSDMPCASSGYIDDESFDVIVLKWCRKNLKEKELDYFGRALHERMCDRVQDGQIKALGYESGDYSASLYDTAMFYKWCKGITSYNFG